MRTWLSLQSCRATPRHQSQSRRCFRVQAELPSIPGLADAGLALTEGALPGSADEKRSSQDVASNGSSEAQNGQIKVKEERLANSNMRLEVTVPVEMLQKAKQKALKQLRADADIPGFRKGQKVLGAFCSYSTYHPVQCSSVCTFLICPMPRRSGPCASSVPFRG